MQSWSCRHQHCYCHGPLNYSYNKQRQGVLAKLATIPTAFPLYAHGIFPPPRIVTESVHDNHFERAPNPASIMLATARLPSVLFQALAYTSRVTLHSKFYGFQVVIFLEFHQFLSISRQHSWAWR